MFEKLKHALILKLLKTLQPDLEIMFEMQCPGCRMREVLSIDVLALCEDRHPQECVQFTPFYHEGSPVN